MEDIKKVSILILLDYLFLLKRGSFYGEGEHRFNPYFIGLPILIWIDGDVTSIVQSVSILILLDYLFLYSHVF